MLRRKVEARQPVTTQRHCQKLMNTAALERARRILAEHKSVLASLRPAPPRFQAPPPPVTEEVSAEEFKMLTQAETLFEKNPGLQRTYKTAEAFGRHCLNTCRKGQS